MTTQEIGRSNLNMSVYRSLTSEYVDGLSPEQAEQAVISIIAERARIRGEGKILSWSEFNENPDSEVNRLLARIMVSQIDKSALGGLTAEQIAVLSIENSAGYLVSEVTREINEKYRLSRTPRIIRVRKSLNGRTPSPSMGEIQASAVVYPITSHGEPKYLIASTPNDAAETEELSLIRVLIPVDDFRATGNTLRGGIDIGVSLLTQVGVSRENISVIPMAGLGKPEQETVKIKNQSGVDIANVITAVDVKFWPDFETDQVMIQANGFPPQPMLRAKVTDFPKPA